MITPEEQTLLNHLTSEERRTLGRFCDALRAYFGTRDLSNEELKAFVGISITVTKFFA